MASLTQWNELEQALGMVKDRDAGWAAVHHLESWEGTRASRCVEEGLSRSFSACSGKPSFPSPSAGDLRELSRVPLRGEGSCPCPPFS